MSELVLIADGDSERGKRIAEACSARGTTCSVVTHGAAALEAALAELPAVLVAQLDLPLIDGAKLAAILHANPRTQSIGVLYVADRGADAQRSGLDGQVFTPPADPDAISRCIHVMLAQADSSRGADDGVSGVDEGGVKGQLSQIALGDLLQLFHVSRKTGTVELVRQSGRHHREVGRVLIRGGDVIQALAGPVEGEKALYRLLTWDRGSFSFTPTPMRSAPRIQTPTQALLREGLRQLEEWKRLKVDLPSRDARATLKIQRSSLPNVLHPLTQEVLLVLEVSSSVGDLLDHCSFPDYQVLRTLHTLINRGMVELRREPVVVQREESAEFFSPGSAARLREWLEAARPRGGVARDAKVLVVAPEPAATGDFAQLLDPIPGVELDARIAEGSFDPADLAPLGRVAVDSELGIELVQLPSAERFAPVWPVAAYGALGTLLLLPGPTDDAVESVTRVAEELRKLPRARIFYLLLLEKGERVAPTLLRENMKLLDEGSLFLIPLENDEKARVLLREMFGRILP